MKISNFLPIGGLVLLCGVFGAVVYLPTQPFSPFQEGVVKSKVLEPGQVKDALISADPPMMGKLREGECYGVTIQTKTDTTLICVSNEDFVNVTKGDTVQFRERGGFHSNADIKVIHSVKK